MNDKYLDNGARKSILDEGNTLIRNRGGKVAVLRSLNIRSIVASFSTNCWKTRLLFMRDLCEQFSLKTADEISQLYATFAAGAPENQPDRAQLWNSITVAKQAFTASGHRQADIDRYTIGVTEDSTTAELLKVVAKLLRRATRGSAHGTTYERRIPPEIPPGEIYINIGDDYLNNLIALLSQIVNPIPVREVEAVHQDPAPVNQDRNRVQEIVEQIQILDEDELNELLREMGYRMNIQE